MVFRTKHAQHCQVQLTYLLIVAPSAGYVGEAAQVRGRPRADLYLERILHFQKNGIDNIRSLPRSQHDEGSQLFGGNYPCDIQMIDSHDHVERDS